MKPEFVCETFVKAEARKGRIVLEFDNVVVVITVEAAFALDSFLEELTE